MTQMLNLFSIKYIYKLNVADYVFNTQTDPMVQWLRLPTANPEILGLESRVNYGFDFLLV
jgi:hypothetical protein